MSAELNFYVREVAEQLLLDLADAETNSKGWTVPRVARKLVFAALDTCLASLAATGIEGRENQAPSAALWEVAGEVLKLGRLQTHARLKPRGYAGDDEILRLIADRQLCKDPLGRVFDAYFQQLDAPEAVRRRIRAASDAILRHASQQSREQYHLAIVGSGPALEVETALSQWPTDKVPAARVTLFDLDPDALAAAEVRLAPQMRGGSLVACRENLFRLASQPRRAAPLAEADFLVCLGLFDYLEEEDAAALLKLFWQSLKPGGVLMVGNFSPACTARTYMEWIGNWYLIYRSQDDLIRLAEAAGIPKGAFEITSTAGGCQLLLRADKPLSP